MDTPTCINVVSLELHHASIFDFVEGMRLLATEPAQALPDYLVSHGTRMDYTALAGDGSFRFIIYQNSRVGYRLIVATRGNIESGFDSGEGAGGRGAAGMGFRKS